MSARYPHCLEMAAAGEEIQAMSQELKYQLRVTLSEPFAKVARNHPDDPSRAPLSHVLHRHNASLKC